MMLYRWTYKIDDESFKYQVIDVNLMKFFHILGTKAANIKNIKFVLRKEKKLPLHA